MIGKDIARFHTIYWPAMLWSAGLAAPRHVWVHGWLLLKGGERMSKSRGNFFDPNDVVAALGSDGARYVTLAEVAFDRDTEVSWESFIRRYNADLANDFGNLVNRTVSMANRYLGGERPGASDGGSLRAVWEATLPVYRAHLEGCLLHAALATLWEFVSAANRLVDAEKPWELAKAAKARGTRSGVRDAAPVERPWRPGRSVPPRRPGECPVPAGERTPGLRPARLCLALCERWQRRTAGPRRAGLGHPLGRVRPAGGPRAALPATRPRARRDARLASRRCA